MAFDEGVAERLREVFAGRDDITEKKMFGGIAFMHRGNMCCGVVNDILMARVDADAYVGALERPHARQMDFTGKPLTGLVYVDPPGFAEDAQLWDWVTLCQSCTSYLPAK
jgi:TfoX/Sxy family transcriptional regulator of competence genes